MLTYVLALLTAPVTTQALEEGRLHVRALFRPLEGSYTSRVVCVSLKAPLAIAASRQRHKASFSLAAWLT